MLLKCSELSTTVTDVGLKNTLCQALELSMNVTQLQWQHVQDLRFFTEASLTLDISLLVVPSTNTKMQIQHVPIDQPCGSNAYAEPFKRMKPIWRRSGFIANMPNGSICPLACAGCTQTGLSDLGHLGGHK